MNAPELRVLADLQAHADQRSMAIDRAGVRGIRHPIGFERTDGSTQQTVATVDMYVGLPSDLRGTHMSRFLEVLQEGAEHVSVEGVRLLMATMLDRLGASSGHIEMRFPYFAVKRAPVSGVASLMDYEVRLRVEVRPDRECETVMRVLVPVTSLCPCSKEISAYGAHNQRSHVTIEAVIAGDVTVEELIATAEAQASCEVYGLLKRPDEKFVTERAYDNPKFVEDLVRDVAIALQRDPRIGAFVVESENFESIHNHSAYALIRRDGRA
jgi:GTP cyclohydrolase IB